MNGPLEGRRWPPVYDEATLTNTIRVAVASLPKQFYLPSIGDPEPCQGDVLELHSEIPVVDADGTAATDGDAHYWLLLANTCDVARTGDTEGVLYVPAAPLVEIDTLPLRKGQADSIHRYETSRMFYVPAWSDAPTKYIADFTSIVPIHRDALRGHARVVARMRLESWVLLNACLVRLLCRGDGRYDQ